MLDIIVHPIHDFRLSRTLFAEVGDAALQFTAHKVMAILQCGVISYLFGEPGR